MSDESSHHLFYHHHKIAIFIAVFVTIILCVIILIQIDFKQNNLDNAEQVIAEQKKQESENNYSSQVKSVLQNYLDLRSQENFNCEIQVPKTVTQILNLTVPLHLKVFHLELIILLDKEKNNCQTQSQNLDLDWQNFLDKNPWLNK